ncbi:TetR/AcrR family transcriptional regulator [Actinoplanes sp. NPDC049596]|uniref:TetR/AcrR family transcriptional regulator n=1 Tax=unclassified Actinoplanes TaxID=2626549 RepID=UPI0034414678
MTTSLRRDAERNRRVLLDTARELMARDGLSVSYEDIARAAGMGMGTIYRRFPDRRDLVTALFSEHVDTVVGFAEEASGDPDAFAGLCRFLERQLELEAANRGLGELLRGHGGPSELVRRARLRMTPLVAGLIGRAVAAGRLPAGVTPGDFVAVHVMVGSVLDASREIAPDLWRRALAVGLAGLRHARLPGDAPGDEVVERLYNDGK